MLAVLGIGVAATPAGAQTDVPDGNGVAIGQTRLYPELRLDYIAYDNVYQAGADAAEVTAVQLSPSVEWRAERRLVELEASYSGRYSAGSEDFLDFNEHEIGLNADIAASSRTAIDAYFGYGLASEELRLNTPAAGEEASERVDVDTFVLGAAVAYGASGARGNVRLGLDIDGYDPDLGDDRDRFVLDRRQFTRVEPFARFSLRVSPDTRLLFEARFADVSRRSGEGRGNSRVTLLTGFNFSTSGAFGGDVRVGVTRISYEGDFTDDDNTARLATSLFYAPTDFSRFTLSLARDFDPRLGDTELGGERAISTTGNLNWRYAYSDRVYHDANLRVEDNATECPLEGNREIGVGVELNVRVRPWIELGANVAHEIDRIEDCDASVVDPTQLETEATQLGVHVRALL